MNESFTVQEAPASYQVMLDTPHVRQGYKQTDVGVIPDDWDVETIVNLASITTGDKNAQDRIDDGAYPFFVRSQTVEHINSYTFDGEAVLTAGDGVGTGKIFHYINGKFDFHQRVYSISKFGEKLDGYYFYLYFSNHFYPRIMQMTAKSSVDSVRREMIADMRIPVPLLEEQHAIATALSDVDALLAAQDKLIAKKRDIKQAAMQKLLTGKQRLPGFTGEWEVKQLGDVGEIVTGSTPLTQIKEYWNGSIPWITPTDISDKKDMFSSEREITLLGLQAIRKLSADSLLVTCIASIGKNAILRNNGACNQQINAIIPNDNNSVEFLYYLVENSKSYLLGNAGITATLMISKKDFSEISFSLPLKEEQNAIATILSDMDADITALEQQRDKTQALKQGMMQQLLTGKIRLI